MARANALIFGLFLLPLGLTGCGEAPFTSEVTSEIARHVDDFPAALAANYWSLSEGEKEKGHAASAEKFRAKMSAAQNGAEVEPEKIADWKVSDAARAELEVAAAKLRARMTDATKKQFPKEIARAQVMFDCWMAQISLSSTSVCREEFIAALAALEQTANTADIVEEK